MREKTLIFIPYQDSDNFLSDGILTREFALLYLFWNAGYKRVINIKKPRTFLDKKRFQIKDEYFPKGTVESKVRKILENSETIQYLPAIDLQQIFERRGWWINGYKKTIGLLDIKNDDYLVYSDNPFAVELIRFISNKGGKLYFDIMDNFAIHPSLSEKERTNALNGYKEILSFADCISANSQQTCDYMNEYSVKNIILVKNGVFLKNELHHMNGFKQLLQIQKAKKKYNRCVGYIGKLGRRLDANLIEAVSQSCADTLFVFVGSYLEGQINEKLLKLFKSDNNVLHVSAIPSAYVFATCNEFDILSIPHAIGKAENGGDPLKLYQYLTRKKPIITTPILGVAEFADYIEISDSVERWIEFIRNDKKEMKEVACYNFDWNTRIRPIMEVINKWNI